MKTLVAGLLCAVALSSAAPVLAQPYPPRPGGPMVPGHDIRGQLDALEGRIRDGIRDGRLDRGETDRALAGLSSIRDEERGLRARNGGELNDVDRGMLQQRIDQLSRSIRWMSENDHRMPPPPPVIAPPPPVIAPPPPPPGSGQWSLNQREDWLQQRVQRGRADGSITRSEAYRAMRELNSIRATQQRLTYRGHGRLRDDDRAMLESRLDRLGQAIRWMHDNGDHAMPWR